MAVTGFWPVYRNLKATLDYADNPDKTTASEYLDEDLCAALRYVENDNKTDRQVFVGGINCSKQNAYAEMIAVQRRFGLRGKVVGYHGIQSFREGEVTPEQAFEIGMETARRMWGCGSPVETSDCNSNQKHRPSRQARPPYQVLVTVHLNTDNIHCHFVVNPVSFKDGSKFQNKIGDHKELRKVSDQICREHGLSVLENSEFYSKGKKKEYWVHKAGKRTHRDMLRQDVDEALAKCGSYAEIEYYLRCLGYIRLTHLIPELLALMDENKMALSVGVELSFLDEQSQREIWEQCGVNDCTPSYAQAVRMRKAFNDSKLAAEMIQSVLSEEKGNQKPRLKIPMERIRKYFPQNYTAAQIEDAIVKLCQRDYRRRTDRER